MAVMNVATKAGSAGGSQLDYVMPELWQKSIQKDQAYKSKLESIGGPEGSQMPVIVKRDLFKKKGDTVHVQVGAKLFDEGKTADSTLEGSEETMSYGQFDKIGRAHV